MFHGKTTISLLARKRHRNVTPEINSSVHVMLTPQNTKFLESDSDLLSLMSQCPEYILIRLVCWHNLPSKLTAHFHTY